MNFDEILGMVTPELYGNMKRAIELGKWPNGDKLSAAQRENCMQMMIAYESRHVAEQERTGYLPPKPTSTCGDPEAVEKENPIKWQ